MAHKSTVFRKVCRIITSLIGIGDSIFLIFAYSNKYWLVFVGYRNLIISIFFLFFSIVTFIVAFMAIIVSKKYFKRLGYYYSLLFVIDFFLIIAILYFSSFKTREEVYYWISEYNSTHQNQQLMIDFFIDYPSNKINSYIRSRTIVVHDVILLTILIWLVFFVLFTFFSHKIMKYLLGKKSSPKKIEYLGQIDSEHIHDIETEYEYEYSYESNDTEKPADKDKRKKINHVRSADEILHLVNYDDKDPQSPLSPKAKSEASDDNSNKEDNSNTKNSDNIASENKSLNQSPSSLNSSLTKTTKQDSDKSSKPAKKKKRKRSQPKSQDQGKFNNEDLSESVVVSISPISNKNQQPVKKKYDIPKRDWSLDRSKNFGLSSDTAPRKAYPKLKYNWNRPINMHLSSDTTSSSLLDDDGYIYSSFILYDSDDSFSFGFDYSDTW